MENVGVGKARSTLLHSRGFPAWELFSGSHLGNLCCFVKIGAAKAVRLVVLKAPLVDPRSP